MKGKIVSVLNQKGGVGKTTSVMNIATAFTAIRKKTLVIDLDPQGNSSTGLGVDKEQKKSRNIYNCLIGDGRIEDLIITTSIDNLDIIPADMDLSAFEVEASNLENRQFILKSKLQNITEKYEYILIDCPPSLGLLSINALTCSDSVLVPMQCEFFAMEGLSHLLKTIKMIKSGINKNLQIEGILLTMYDKRNSITKNVEQELREMFGDIVYKTVIPRNIKLSEAPSHGLPAIVYDSKCVGSEAYISLVREMMQKFKKF